MYLSFLYHLHKIYIKCNTQKMSFKKHQFDFISVFRMGENKIN